MTPAPVSIECLDAITVSLALVAITQRTETGTRRDATIRPLGNRDGQLQVDQSLAARRDDLFFSTTETSVSTLSLRDDQALTDLYRS